MTLTSTLTSQSKSLATSLCLLFAAGTVVVPNVAMAADHAAPILPAAPSQTAAAPASSSGGNALSGSGGALLSDNGSPVMTGAWCDPVTNTCQQHPWSQGNSHEKNRGR
jgi:hypothetical protein